jgi:hypothetical protein
MSKKSSTTAMDSSLPASQTNAQLAAGLASADSMAAERVQNLQWVHQARVAQLMRTATSLKAQYGNASAEAKSAEDAVTAASATASGISMTYQQLTTADPQVAQGGWALHGRVFDSQSQPVSGHTVFLVDAKNAYQQAFGFSYTDETGYFLLKYEGSDSTSGNKPEAEQRADASAQLFIEVADTKAKPVSLSTTAFQPVVGSATYQNITLAGGDQPIGDPPPEIASIAMPARKRRKS